MPVCGLVTVYAGSYAFGAIETPNYTVSVRWMLCVVTTTPSQTTLGATCCDDNTLPVSLETLCCAGNTPPVRRATSCGDSNTLPVRLGTTCGGNITLLDKLGEWVMPAGGKWGF